VKSFASPTVSHTSQKNSIQHALRPAVPEINNHPRGKNRKHASQKVWATDDRQSLASDDPKKKPYQKENALRVTDLKKS
jgi:hypothetical protein